MTRKERILKIVSKLPDDVSYDQVLYKLGVLRAVEAGTTDMEAGRVMDNDELVDELLKEDTQDKDQLDRTVGTRSARNSTISRKGSKSKNGSSVREAASKRGQTT